MTTKLYSSLIVSHHHGQIDILHAVPYHLTVRFLLRLLNVIFEVFELEDIRGTHVLTRVLVGVQLELILAHLFEELNELDLKD